MCTGGWGFFRIICFENGFEFGTINTLSPMVKLVMALVYISRVLAVLMFAYLVWKKTRDELGQDTNSFLWSALVAFFIGGRVGFGFTDLLNWNTSLWDWLFFWDKQGFNLLVGLVSLVAFVMLYTMFERWNFVELVEDLVIPGVMLSFFWLLPVWLGDKNVVDMWIVGGLMLVFVLSFWARKYRSFYWYKSGKKGFLFLFSGLIFSILMFVASFVVEMSLFYRYLALVFSLIFLISLVMLGELFNSEKK